MDFYKFEKRQMLWFFIFSKLVAYDVLTAKNDKLFLYKYIHPICTHTSYFMSPAGAHSYVSEFLLNRKNIIEKFIKFQLLLTE